LAAHAHEHPHPDPPLAPGALGSVAAHHRKSVSQLLPNQLADLRTAFAKTQALSDDRGYQFHAGIHGLPLPKYCKIAHGQPFFLAWHRAYLYTFELALRDQVGTVSLAWWDWRTVREVPGPFALEKVDGKPNPLHSMPVNELARQQGGKDPLDEGSHELAGHATTFRQPARPGAPPLPGAEDVSRVLALGDFFDFQDQLEGLHNDVHVWVGGHMGDIAFASYDPLFWAHHAMIDRLWRIWQTKHPQSGLPEGYLRAPLPPFSLNIGQTLNTIALGYDYALTTARTSAGGHAPTMT